MQSPQIFKIVGPRWEALFPVVWLDLRRRGWSRWSLESLCSYYCKSSNRRGSRWIQRLFLRDLASPSSRYGQPTILNLSGQPFDVEEFLTQLVEVFGSQYCPASRCRGMREGLHEKVKWSFKISNLFIALDLSDQRQQVGKRLLQEKDDKDLLILLGDIPKLKVS